MTRDVKLEDLKYIDNRITTLEIHGDFSDPSVEEEIERLKSEKAAKLAYFRNKPETAGYHK